MNLSSSSASSVNLYEACTGVELSRNLPVDPGSSVALLRLLLDHFFRDLLNLKYIKDSTLISAPV